MKKIFKEISIYSLPFLGLIIFLIFINIIKKDFNILEFLRKVGKHISVNYMMAKDSVKNSLPTL